MLEYQTQSILASWRTSKSKGLLSGVARDKTIAALCDQSVGAQACKPVRVSEHSMRFEGSRPLQQSEASFSVIDSTRCIGIKQTHGHVDLIPSWADGCLSAPVQISIALTLERNIMQWT